MDQVRLPGTRVERFESSLVDQEFELQIAVLAAAGSDEPMPVVYLMDANTTFAAVNQMIGLLQIGQHLPPLCLVGVGYPFEHAVTSTPERLGEWIRLRARDLISARVDHTVLPHRVLETWGGGAQAFLECLMSEVEPRLTELVTVDQTRRTVVGHSCGGHFAIYSALSRPDFFPYALAASPVLLNYNGLASLVEPWAEKVPTLDARVFIGVAEAEREQLVAEAYLIAGAMRSAAPDAKIDTHSALDETHLSVWPTLYAKGLTHLFGNT